MSDVFISYAHEDTEKAKILAGALEHAGWNVWWDRTIPPGGNWAQFIEESIESAHAVIVLWSRHSVSSDWVHKEARKGSQRKILIPALIDDADVPFEFEHIQAVQLKDWRGQSDHPEFQRLAAAVTKLVRPVQAETGGQDSEDSKDDKGTGDGRPVPLWLRFILAIALVGALGAGGVRIFCGGDDPDYRVRLTVLNPAGNPVGDATKVKVTSSIGVEGRPAAGAWVFAIDEEDLPNDRRVRFHAEMGQTFGDVLVTFGDDPAPTADLRLLAQVRGTVTDRDNHRLRGIRVSLVGLEADTAVTKANGSFVILAPVHTGETVRLRAEGEGFETLEQQHIAGPSPASLVLDRSPP